MVLLSCDVRAAGRRKRTRSLKSLQGSCSLLIPAAMDYSLTLVASTALAKSKEFLPLTLGKLPYINWKLLLLESKRWSTQTMLTMQAKPLIKMLQDKSLLYYLRECYRYQKISFLSYLEDISCCHSTVLEQNRNEPSTCQQHHQKPLNNCHCLALYITATPAQVVPIALWEWRLNSPCTNLSQV